MIFLFLLLLVILVIAVLLIRGQLRQQHRETLQIINPEKFAELERREKYEMRIGWIALLCCIGLFAGMYGCWKVASDSFKKYPPKTESRPN